MTWLAIKAINFYQKYISPYKGFRCAHGVATGEISCSGYGKKVIKRFGLFTGLKLLNRRFYDCSWHSKQLNKLKDFAKDKDYKVYRPVTGYRLSQGGFVDCDCGGCDVPSCDMPSCDVGDCVPDINCSNIDVCDVLDVFDCIPDDCGKNNTSQSFKEKRNKKNEMQYGSADDVINQNKPISLSKDDDESGDED